MDDIKIYIMFHNEKDIKNIEYDECYIPLFVGRNGKNNFGFCSDDVGDNISYRNPSYSEMTGLYWVWKNINADICGLVHYRRFFIDNNGKKLDKEFITKTLQEYDIILPKKGGVFFDTVYETYDHWHYGKDLDTSKKIIEELYPEYIENYENVIEKGNEMYYYNMFITSKDIMDEYCEWIFPLLDEVEKRSDTTKYSNYQKRISAFLSERLFNVWLDKQNLKIKEMPVNVKGSKINLHTLIFTSKFITIPYKFYVKYINKNAKRR